MYLPLFYAGLLSDSCNESEVSLARLSLSESDRGQVLLDKSQAQADTRWSSNARDTVLRRCRQTHPLPFDECYPDQKLQNCRKIGEGAYGEVFLYKNRDEPTRPIVMKVIPIEGTLMVNNDHQKKFHEIISEIVIAMELSELRKNKTNCTYGFNEVRSVRCVKGRYPERLLELWELYDEQKGSENDCPNVFGPSQLYVVLELANGGTDLEAYRFTGAHESYSLFFQIALTLAIAEEAFQFEHRDLHWGNVLINKTCDEVIDFTLRGNKYSVPSCGIVGNIIDFTLSRITFPRAGVTIFNDLSKDPELFEAEGGDYQFEVYKLMKKNNGDNWKDFEPRSNIFWLHYVLLKMINDLRYEKTKTKQHKSHIAKLRELEKNILKYESCIDFVTSNNFDSSSM